MMKHVPRGAAALFALALITSSALADTDLSFSPPYNGNATVAITANATPSSVSGTLPAQGGNTRIRVCNSGTTQAVFFRLSTVANPTAVATDPVLLPATCLQVDGQAPFVAAAVLNSQASGTPVIFFTWGSGGL